MMSYSQEIVVSGRGMRCFGLVKVGVYVLVSILLPQF